VAITKGVEVGSGWIGLAVGRGSPGVAVPLTCAAAVDVCAATVYNPFKVATVSGVPGGVAALQASCMIIRIAKTSPGMNFLDIEPSETMIFNFYRRSIHRLGSRKVTFAVLSLTFAA
jgi:hypothetical protein